MFLKHTAFIALGANLGDPEKQIEQAIEILSGSVQIVKISSFYHSKALVLSGQESQNIPDYTNAVALIRTELGPLELLELLLLVEKNMGRTRRERWEPRVIDLDVLTYDDLILQSDRLTLPHPEMTKRDFVLRPLAEIEPEWVHPVGGEKISLLISRLPASS